MSFHRPVRPGRRIGRAKVVHRDGDLAFLKALLRRYSQDHNVKLRDVARQLIDTRELP